MRLVPLLLAGALLAPAAARAQRLDTLPLLRPGRYVRVYPSERLVPYRAGTVLAVDSAALTIRRPPGWARHVVTIPLDSARRVDVRLRESRKLEGTLKGALWGTAIVGGVVGVLLANDDGTGEGQALGIGYTLMFGVPVFVGGGAAIGWATAPGARWQRVYQAPTPE